MTVSYAPISYSLVFTIFYLTLTFALDCSKPFKLGESTYNFEKLNKLITLKNNVTTHPTITEFMYEINPCKPLELKNSIDKKDQCVSDTFICETITNYKDTPRITQVISFGANKTSVSIIHEEGLTTKLVWTSQGEKIENQQKSSKIEFTCDDKESTPVFDSLSGDVLLFKWVTPVACAIDSSPNPTKPDKPSDNNPPASSSGFTFGFLITALLLAYLVGGMAYNHFVLRYRGIYLIPHLNFWREFPDHFMSLLHHMVSMVSGRRRSTYNRV